MMPLLAPSDILKSSWSSNQVNFSAVTMSPALCGSTQASVALVICQPGLTPSFLKLCQPASDFPSKSSFQPAALSAAVSELMFIWLSAAGRVKNSPKPVRNNKGNFMRRTLAKPQKENNGNAPQSVLDYTGRVTPQPEALLDCWEA